MFVSDLLLGEAEFAPGLCSGKLVLGYLLRVCVEEGIRVIAPGGEKRYVAGVNNSSLSFSRFFQVWCASSLRDERNSFLALDAEYKLFGTVSDGG